MGAPPLAPADRATLARHPLLAPLSERALSRILAHSRLVELPAGAAIFARDDPADEFFIVLDGFVKLTRDGHDGAPVVIATFAGGESFAEAAAFSGGGYPVWAETVRDSRLLAIPGLPFVEEIRRDGGALSAALATLFRHLHALVDQVEALKGRTARQRVAGFLCRLAGRASGGATLTLPYDKVLIAATMGTTPENLSRVLAGLKADGVTTYRDKAIVEDLAHLSRIAEGRDEG